MSYALLYTRQRFDRILLTKNDIFDTLLIQIALFTENTANIAFHPYSSNVKQG